MSKSKNNCQPNNFSDSVQYQRLTCSEDKNINKENYYFNLRSLEDLEDKSEYVAKNVNNSNSENPQKEKWSEKLKNRFICTARNLI